MPDLLLLTFSIFAAAGCSGGCCFIQNRWLLFRTPAGTKSLTRQAFQILTAVAVTCGTVAGFAVQGLRPAVPPSSALDRWMVLLLPAWLSCELLAGCLVRRPRLLTAVRLLLAAATPAVLLFHSVHLGVMPGRPALFSMTPQGLWLLSACSVVSIVAMVRLLLPAAVPPLARAISSTVLLHGAGMLIMLGGWIRGGAAVFPLTGACCGALAVACLLQQQWISEAISRWAAWCLLNMVLLGHFFGRLSGVDAAGLLLAAFVLPLLVQRFPRTSPRRQAAILVLSTVVVLGGLLWIAWSQFTQRMKPLIAAASLQAEDN